MLEKLGGLATIVVTITALFLLHLVNPPIWIQILSGLVGSFFCLIGIVFLFAEGRLLTEDHWIKQAVKASWIAKLRMP